jgi:signal transduction histidine kinase
MWNRFKLKTQIYIILTALLLISLTGGIMMIWYTYYTDDLLVTINEENLIAYQSAEALAISLVNQKGYVSYYFMDGNPDWLRQLGEYRQIFKERLKEARFYATDRHEKDILKTIANEYAFYIDAQDIVISYYEAGEIKAGAELHPEVRKRFFKILELCGAYRDSHNKKMEVIQNKSQNQRKQLRYVVGAAMSVELVLAIFLMYILVMHILRPLHKLATEIDKSAHLNKIDNVVNLLSSGVHGLLKEFDQTSYKLEKSRTHLQQAEKMALVGKLAAGMAHSIRNPFTSVQMRLFSLKRSLVLTDVQKEDLDVIAEEIKHIDTIVQNFLEFSRAPKLKFQTISPSTVVDMTIQLLQHRLKSYDVEVSVIRNGELPMIQADPEQLKEVLVNIIINACEAMHTSGTMKIVETYVNHPRMGPVGEIRLVDDGPGIAEEALEQIFEPFFTTKEEGTGLGLSIVKKIIEEHQGRIDVSSEKGRGTSFIITLPLKE